MYETTGVASPNQRYLDFQHAVDTKVIPERTAFPGIPASIMPATQVGISRGFSVDAHRDSSQTKLTETIFWPNRGLQNTYFIVPEYNIKFDVGSVPCMVLIPPSIQHATAPGHPESVGLVLISKRGTLTIQSVPSPSLDTPEEIPEDAPTEREGKRPRRLLNQDPTSDSKGGGGEGGG